MFQMLVKLSIHVHFGFFQRNIFVEKINYFFYILNSKNVDSFNNGGLFRILLRKNKSFKTFFLRFDGNRQRAPYGLQISIEREFAHNNILCKWILFFILSDGNESSHRKL